MRVMPTAAASSAARRPSSSSRPIRTTSWSMSASHASLLPKPARSIVLRHRPRDVPVVELQVGAGVDQQGAPLAVLVNLARRERVRLHAVAPERAAVERHDPLEVRRLGAEPADDLVDELVFVVDAQGGVVRPLEPDRGGHLEVHARASAHRAAEVARPNLDLGGQRQQPLVQRAVDRARAVHLVDREIRPRDVADEQRVACQDRPGRVVAALAVDEHQCRVLGPVARGVKRAHLERAELEFPAVVERLVLVRRLGVTVDVDRRAGGGRETAMARDVIGVVVGLDDVLDRHPEVARQRQVSIDVKPRVHDRRHAGALIADQV